MKPLCVVLVAVFSFTAFQRSQALPQDFGDLSNLLNGGLFGGGLALDDRDLTDAFVKADVWDGKQPLEGEWNDAYRVGYRTIHHITKSPTLFGHRPIGIEASYIEKELERVSIYYAESGTFFGYQPELRDSDEGKQALKAKQQEFRKVFAKLEKSLRKNLETYTKDGGEALTEGFTSPFKTRFQQYEFNELAIQLRVSKDFYIRVDLRRQSEVQDRFLDPAVADQDKRQRAASLRSSVSRNADGDTNIPDVPMIFQGGRAYCGITTYLMIAQYLGLQMDPATMASVSGFRYGMGGNKIIEAYTAASKEADLRMNRTTKFDFERAKKSIDAGIPMLVWRKYDNKRNYLHTRMANQGKKKSKVHFVSHPGVRGDVVKLPEPDDADRASWPGQNAPNHSSVITGYNAERKELIFSDSWGEHARNKRMRAEELVGTAYMTFYFKH